VASRRLHRPDLLGCVVLLAGVLDSDDPQPGAAEGRGAVDPLGGAP
jgi:hypothetical protein